MIREGFNGFCMALADSVPGVSGGTVAFIMGFYDKFIGSINSLVFGNRKEKKQSAGYLVKLGIGWVIGMALAALVLSNLFESHIYTVSSLFIGFIAGSIPLIVMEEKESFKQVGKGIGFGIAGALVVIGIAWLNGQIGSSSMNLGQFSIGLGVKLFFIGMIAISAMFLPGISGSTLLLIFGAYIPVITVVKEICIHDLWIQVNNWKVYKGGKEIKLPNREFELLKFLAMNPNIVFSKEQLFEKIWGYDYMGDSATVMVHINRIREKIEDDSKNPKILETVWGAGYRLNTN